MPGNMVIKETLSVTKAVTKLGEGILKKPWSIMDAASKKMQPGEFLSKQAMQSVQGKPPGTS